MKDQLDLFGCGSVQQAAPSGHAGPAAPPQELLKKLAALNSCADIVEGRIRGVVDHGGTSCAVTGASYRGETTLAVFLQPVVPEAEYAGTVATYQERVRSEVRGEAFYEGVSVQCGKERWVLTGIEVELREREDA